MPWRLKITILLSVLFHLGLVALFVVVSFKTFQKIASLTPAGGVIWLNLNPGGSGSGGSGGLGAPEKNLPENPKPVVANPTPAQPPVAKKTSGEIKAPVKPKPKIPAIPEAIPPEAATPSTPAKELPKQAFPGPGTGDTQGKGSGPGGGQDQGKGGGEGGGEGSGKGPGGVGPPGTGGDGSGGEGNKILGQIRAKILRAKRYPREARQEGLEGVCGIVFRINPDGSVDSLSLAQSSGHDILDQEALATVRRAAPFPYYSAPIQFKLRFNLEDR